MQPLFILSSLSPAMINHEILSCCVNINHGMTLTFLLTL
ncbi:hypothetical protein FHU10_2141 [Serratia fonticola]|uniref:Uncharacterized protein n=1 Tax=Serratia fonticola TaxID=47917 RepID=A0A559T4U7_SERFO|nr:hypothetical protein FHU09_0310 [Serratia fonticola]TQI95123.1 hypothetical protein FHU11_0482 [Serratia fonticola]TVZ69621.1 hypothetical protein FHU10_2141 [Serratia fonticola]